MFSHFEIHFEIHEDIVNNFIDKEDKFDNTTVPL